MIVSSNTPVLFWNQLEMRRKRELKRLAGSNNALSHKQSFNLMRSIERDARRHQANLNTFMTVLIWVSFWLIGALVFHFTEDWKYFDAVYFCFLCFLTIGYGDYAPKSPAGRTFFIVWALAAVPLMTGLFSNIGERLYDLSNRGIRSRVFLKLFSRRSSTSNPFLHVFASRVKDMEDPIDENETEVIAEIISEASKTTFDSKADRTKTILNSMKRLVLGSIKDSSEKQKFEYEFWKSILEMRNYSLYDNTNSSRIEEKFWLSELSPLRLPISESNYLLYLLFKQLESELLGDSAEEESQRKKDE
jgi:potassium channel subfamily K